MILAPVAPGLPRHQRTRITTYLAERTAQPRPIRPESQLFNYNVPDIFVVVLSRNLLGGTTSFVFRSNIRPRLEELVDAPLIPSQSSPVQRSETVTIRCIRIRTHLEQDLRRDLVALVHSPMQCRVSHVVSLVDGDVRLAKNIQQCPVVGRMDGGVDTFEALSIEEMRVRAVSDE